MIHNIPFNSTIYSKSSILCNMQAKFLNFGKKKVPKDPLCGSSENHLFYPWTLKINYFGGVLTEKIYTPDFPSKQADKNVCPS